MWNVCKHVICPKKLGNAYSLFLQTHKHVRQIIATSVLPICLPILHDDKTNPSTTDGHLHNTYDDNQYYANTDQNLQGRMDFSSWFSFLCFWISDLGHWVFAALKGLRMAAKTEKLHKPGGT